MDAITLGGHQLLIKETYLLLYFKSGVQKACSDKWKRYGKKCKISFLRGLMIFETKEIIGCML